MFTLAINNLKTAANLSFMDILINLKTKYDSSSVLKVFEETIQEFIISGNIMQGINRL
ncbi:hypothetical protein LCGC14_0123110 [marine sediment metagenome]|uniref:Uncharacterized protein n=1 Tax=marine sediment metagenome TaxID=412755 RepID=A0A0F9Y8F0_9ZZZZ